MRAAALALLITTAAGGPARAQAPAAAAEAGGTPRAEKAEKNVQDAGPAVDPLKLGISMSRIQRGLRISEAREQSSGTPLKLEYQIQVFGTAPRIDMLQGFDIRPGTPVPYGAPTHTDFLNHWTPQAYRAPPANLGALAGWALIQLVKRADTSACEQALAEYRALVMQGIPVAAPRCAQ